MIAAPLRRDEPIHTTRVQALVAQQGRLARAIKRLIDIGMALVLLMLTAPVLVVLAVLIRLQDRGPALYAQPRIGLNQRPFIMVKLRTMDDRGRVTPLGRLLRPLGIDELPQLWNVLKGDMSIVGPRPEVMDRVPGWQQQFPDYWARHLMRPGITGWAQVNGLRGDVSIARRLAFDLQYQCSWSLRLDFRILVLTLGAVWADTRRDLLGD